MWATQRDLFKDISDAVMGTNDETSPGLTTLLSSAAIFVLVANREVRFGRALAFRKPPLRYDEKSANGPERGTTRAL